MRVHEDFRERMTRQRQDEAERIAIRMGFHRAFVLATVMQRAGRDRGRSPN
jgi:hypothetical protein